MKRQERFYDAPTKEQLDTIKVSDLILCNDWKQPLTVREASNNFFIMSRNVFGKCMYSICQKTPADFSRNYIVEGRPIIGMDNYVFGIYDYLNPEECKEAIQKLESGELEVSVRHSCALNTIRIRSIV